jgi:hypothetical protein
MGAGASVSDPAVAASIEKCKALLSPVKCKELWSRTDFNGNGYVSLAEIDKLIVEMQNDPGSPFVGFNNKPALMRAYKASCLGGKNGDWVERGEFPFLLRNLFFFDKLWTMFDSMDKDRDRRITAEELAAASKQCPFINDLSPTQVAQVFDEMDTNDGGKVLFDEFCTYTANKFIDATQLDACFEGTPAAGKPPRAIGKKVETKGRTGKTESDVASVKTQKFDAAESKVLAQVCVCVCVRREGCFSVGCAIVGGCGRFRAFGIGHSWHPYGRRDLHGLQRT